MLRMPNPPASTRTARIAESHVLTWQAIGDALGPVIGRAGVAALYERARHLNRASHPWLARRDGDRATSSMDLVALKASLGRQDPVEAATGAEALLRSFREVLAGLIGIALSDLLLRSVWDAHLARISTEETPP
jgi:hypothetical protein